MTQPPIAILKAGSTFTSLQKTLQDFEDWTCREMGLRRDQVRIVDISRGEALPPLSAISAAVITGSHAMVTDREPWMQATLTWLQQAVQGNLPILGICFGHQLLAEALGGQADWNPFGRELGTLTVTLTPEGRQDALLGGLPPSFPAHLTHRQSVVRLPPGARLLASSSGDKHQAFTVGSAYGVQFHPEFPQAAMQCYVDLLAPELREEGFDLAALRSGIRPTPAATSLLQRFCRLVRGYSR